MNEDNVTRIPWSPAQVRRLQERQCDPRYHPYTCPMESHSGTVLRPTRTGWVCPECSYRQDWAWRHDVELESPEMPGPGYDAQTRLIVGHTPPFDTLKEASE